MTMDPHESRDLDGVIDDVARAMTAAVLTRDLRPAVASRMTSGSSWTFGWRAGLAAAAVVAIVLAAVLLRPSPATLAPRVAEVAAPVSTTRVPPAAVVRAADAAPPVVRRRDRAAARRQIVAAAAGESGVEIEPLANLPLEDGRAATPTHARVEIAPIDVEPVRIREFGEQVE